MGRRSMQIVQVPVENLQPYERNARTHSTEQIEQLARSIKEFGWTMPILVDKNRTIIAGHARAAAARMLGISHVPTIQLDGLSEQQVRAYVIADNRIAEAAEWNDETLAAELGALERLGFDLELVGYDSDELLAMLGTSAEDTSAVDDHVPEPPMTPITRPGDVWVLGLSRLMCGDATKEADVLRACGGTRPLLMLTDAPYGAGDGQRADWAAAWRLFPGDVAYVWHDALYTADVARQLARTGLDVRAQLVWKKARVALSGGHYHPQHECCWYAVRHGKQARWAGGRTQSTVWEVAAGEDDRASPPGAQKPVELLRRALRNHALEGRTVYEPFLGSGATLVACQREGLALRALELEPHYVDAALERWQTITGQEPRLEVDGAPGLAEVRRQRSE